MKNKILYIIVLILIPIFVVSIIYKSSDTVIIKIYKFNVKQNKKIA